VLDDLTRRGAKELTAATLYYKPSSIVKPKHYVSETTDWVVFPWEIFETIKELADGMQEKELEDIKIQLKNIGLPASMVEVYFSYN
jgi:hypoxanthine phosphoribosyltransferase